MERVEGWVKENLARFEQCVDNGEDEEESLSSRVELDDEAAKFVQLVSVQCRQMQKQWQVRAAEQGQAVLTDENKSDVEALQTPSAGMWGNLQPLPPALPIPARARGRPALLHGLSQVHRDLLLLRRRGIPGVVCGEDGPKAATAPPLRATLGRQQATRTF